MISLYFLLFYNIFLVNAGDSSLTFVIDDSGSMSDDIEHVRKGARGIMDIVLNYKASQIKDIVLVTFNDPKELTEVKIKTRDPDKLVKALSSIKAHNTWENQDWPEYALSGIELGLTESQPNSYLFVFTDASAKDYNEVELVKSMCQKTQTQIWFILTDYCPSSSDVACIVYHNIAEACSGQVIVVSKSDIDKVLGYVRETIKGNKSIIKTVTVPRHKWTTIEFEVDDKTEYVLISLAGMKVDFKNVVGLKNPKVVLSTGNSLVLRLEDPAPGTYKFSAYGDSQVSVMIFSRTDFLFEHGFSQMIPKSLTDTSKQPIADEQNYLSIHVTDPDHEVRIDRAQILDMNEKVIRELPLQKINRDFYVTKQFVAPNKLFKVAVVGTVIKTGKTIKRFTKTPIEPQKPKLKPIEKMYPVTRISEGNHVQVPYKGALQLTCSVSAYPAPTVVWKDNKGKIYSAKTSPVELPYKYISYLTLSGIKANGTSYSCIANNKLSTHQSRVVVTVLSPFNVQRVGPGTNNVRYGEDTVIECKIKSALPIRINWFRDVSKVITPITTSDKYTISSSGTELRIKLIDLESAGQYTCKAELIDDPTQHTEYKTNVVIVDAGAPVLDKSRPIVTAKVNTTVVLECRILSGNPKPILNWEFQRKGSDKFVTLPGSGEKYKIPYAAFSNAGNYKCTATNVISKDDLQTQLIVRGPPTIILNDGKTKYTAIEGDFVLKVPCNAVGYPDPDISWTRGGKTVKADNKISFEGTTLVIKNPVRSDTASYLCEAKNNLGKVNQIFDVEVTEYILEDEDYGDKHKIYILKNESKSIRCNLPHGNKDVIRWYSQGIFKGIIGPEFYIKNAILKDDGNYTCRVSTPFGSKSDTYEVDVGYPPQFKNEFSGNIDWNGDEEAILDCKVESKPPSEVTWWYNDKAIEHKSPELKLRKWGKYDCQVKNPHTTIGKSFNVHSSQCLINTRLGRLANIPLLLAEDSSWLQLESVNSSIVVHPGTRIKMSCHNQNSRTNTFKKLHGKTEVLAMCEKEDDFLVNDTTYKLSDLVCDKEVTPVVIRTGAKCLKENSELIKVGYNLDQFVEAYQVCFDKTKNVPLYAHSTMSSTSGVVVAATHSWTKYPGFDDRRPEGYTCGKSLSCCYDKGQLINAHDISYGPAQQSTFLDHINSVAVWRPCDNSKTSWVKLEEGIREAFGKDNPMSVWSGASSYEAIKGGATVPRYLWKVLKYDAEKPVVAVYINGKPTKHDIRCSNLCAYVDPPGLSINGKSLADDHLYCCNLQDFAKAFQLPIETFDDDFNA